MGSSGGHGSGSLVGRAIKCASREGRTGILACVIPAYWFVAGMIDA